jgi:hypothetical protein
VESQREKTRQRVAKHEAKGKPNGAANAPPNAVSNAIPNTAPVPTRPDPTDLPTERRARAAPAAAVLSASEQRELDAIDPPEDLPFKEPELHVLVWEAWSAIAHGGLPAGSMPRTEVFACCEVLRARGKGVAEFSEATARWAERKRKTGGVLRFRWLAEDLAQLLDGPVRERGAPVPVSSAESFAADGPDDFDALMAQREVANG